jgi:hypothetical protein
VESSLQKFLKAQTARVFVLGFAAFVDLGSVTKTKKRANSNKLILRPGITPQMRRYWQILKAKVLLGSSTQY